LGPGGRWFYALAVGETDTRASVLVVEDDDGDFLLVAELLDDALTRPRVVRARSLAAALAGVSGGIDCVLLDLGLPDATGLGALARVRDAAPAIAVIVLTGLDDEAAGIAAVDAGAQDYLIKGRVDARMLARAIRYAIGRRQAEEAAQQLRIAGVRADENARLERGLVPSPIVADDAIWTAASYRPGRHRALLGGDFYDVVQAPDGHIHAAIGDVCGHGPDEAALGACLRIAWRTLVLSGAGGDLALATLQRLLEHERQIPGLFATLCTLAIDPTHRVARMRRAGHPPPVLIDGASISNLPSARGGPPIGVVADATWAETGVALPPGWSLLLYTDGLIEGRVDGGTERLGDERLHDLIADHVTRHADWRDRPDDLLRGLLARAEELNGEELSDDVAMLLIGSRPAAAGGG
jgi:serine phosphatase RsbU (regulator of sigma subunit)